MTWLIDTDVFIEAERGNPAFVPWLESVQSVATADIVTAFQAMGCPCANPL
jgi:predicted nucleic acid-binding protein